MNLKKFFDRRDLKWAIIGGIWGIIGMFPLHESTLPIPKFLIPILSFPGYITQDILHQYFYSIFIVSPIVGVLLGVLIGRIIKRLRK